MYYHRGGDRESKLRSDSNVDLLDCICGENALRRVAKSCIWGLDGSKFVPDHGPSPHHFKVTALEAWGLAATTIATVDMVVWSVSIFSE